MRENMPLSLEMPVIRPLAMQDFPDWLPLWDGNNLGSRNEGVTRETWARLLDPDSPVYGLGAVMDGHMAGILHYVLHPTTGSIAPVCYMQDVYVDPDFRRRGVARSMVHALGQIGRRERWSRLYWLADAKNEAAQNLYKTLGVGLNFTLHVMPLQ